MDVGGVLLALGEWVVEFSGECWFRFYKSETLLACTGSVWNFGSKVLLFLLATRKDVVIHGQASRIFDG